MLIKALKRNIQKQYSNLSSKGNKNWNKRTLCTSDNKTMDLVIRYLLSATVMIMLPARKPYFLIDEFCVFNLKVQGPFQGLLQKWVIFQDISRTK